MELGDDNTVTYEEERFSEMEASIEESTVSHVGFLRILLFLTRSAETSTEEEWELFPSNRYWSYSFSSDYSAYQHETESSVIGI